MLVETEKLEIFINEQRKKTLCDNFTQVYFFKGACDEVLNLVGTPGISIKNAALRVDFSQISDVKILSFVSQKAESDYLRELANRRELFLKEKFENRHESEKIQGRIEFEKWLCRHDLYYLGKFVLGYNKAVFHFHKFMCDTMANLPTGYRGLREFPRDSYKSTFMTISFIVQRVLIDPNIKILIKSNKQKNAASKLNEARNHFLKNQKIRQLFPEHVPQKRDDYGNNNYWKSPANKSVQDEGSFNASGVGSSETSQHYDLIIGDDFWDEKSVTSPEMITKVSNDLKSIEWLLSRPEEGQIIFIGTRFSYDDPTIELSKDRRYHCVIVSGITKVGRSLFPESMSINHLYDQYRSHRYGFSCQVMLNPSSEDSQFSEDWFKDLSYQEILQSERNGKIIKDIVILTDAAGDDKTSSDPVAIMAVVKDSYNRKTVIDYTRKKMNPLAFINEIERMYDKYNSKYIVRQKVLLETAIKPFIDEKNKQRVADGEKPMRFVDISLGKRSKTARMAALQPYFQKGEIYFDPMLLNGKELKNEILTFPFNMTNDDGMDALSEITDEFVSKCPSWTAPVEKPKEELPTSESVHTQEMEWRRQCAQRANDRFNIKNKKVERPGQLCAA